MTSIGLGTELPSNTLRFNFAVSPQRGSTTLNRGHAATAICWTSFGGRPRRFGATQAGKGT
jgi:hypothetical protein